MKTPSENTKWQLVKNWLERNDRNHILRIWTIPFDKMAKCWKFMILDITMISVITINHDFGHNYVINN